MRKVFITLFILFNLSILIHAEDLKDIYFKNLFNTLYESIDLYNRDYALISGLYSANGVLKGSATIGNFPSFRAGASTGFIFFNNPIRFLKNINYSSNNWNNIRQDSFPELSENLDWFDANCLPIPVVNYFFEIGLFKGFSVGGSFHAAKGDDFVNAVSDKTDNYFKNFLLWGIGVNFSYTIMKEHKLLPSISVGSGINYSDTAFSIENIPVSPTYLNPSNPRVETKMGFSTHNYITSFSFDFTASKKIFFFQPFVNFRFTQSINYNISEFSVEMDMSNTTAGAKEIYGDGKYKFTNFSIKEGESIPRGDITPVGDFILNAGFEFIIKIFRLGIQASFSTVSQKGMILLDMRFQVEDWQFKKLSKYKKPDLKETKDLKENTDKKKEK